MSALEFRPRIGGRVYFNHAVIKWPIMFKVSYQAPQFSVSHQAYVNHGAITRPKVFPKHKSALFLKTPSLGLCARESVQAFEFPSAERYWGSIVVQNLGCPAKDGYSLGRFGEKTHSERPKIISISWYLCVKYHDKSFFQIVHHWAFESSLYEQWRKVSEQLFSWFHQWYSKRSQKPDQARASPMDGQAEIRGQLAVQGTYQAIIDQDIRTGQLAEVQASLDFQELRFQLFI